MTDRPLECSHCKKKAKVIYKEIIGDSIITTEMCVDCPILEQKLHGPQPKEGRVAETGIYCGNCKTSLDSIKMGNPLGCSECYSVFADVLIQELIAEDKIPPTLAQNIGAKKAQPIHIGKSPQRTVEIISSSNRLIVLNEALNDAIKKENYEQAAWLRDQIKALTEKKQ